MIEIRHYVNRAGKDVFDEWLTQLADARAKAKIATRINRLAAGILATASRCVRVYSSYGAIEDQAIAPIMR